MKKPIFEGGKLTKPDKERWVDIICPGCEKKIMAINLESYLPGYIKSISCPKCNLETQNWMSWTKKKNGQNRAIK